MKTTFDINTSPLSTDLYQLTMLQGYIEEDMHEQASFEFFFRRLPKNRSFLISAGLESVIDFIEGLHFTREELSFLSRTGRFSKKLISYLRDFRFSGDVSAIPEGMVFFPNEPLIRVTAPIAEAQLIESRLINLLHLQVLIASKAARSVLAAGGRASLIDFGMRRAHGAESALYAARSSYITGFMGSSNVMAEALFGIPSFGTMAHSYVEAHSSEQEAFIEFALANPGNVTLLIDTYDTVRGAEKTVEVARILKEKGITVRAVRLDSGDLVKLSQQVRKVLDGGGFPEIRIMASGNIDEYVITELLSRRAELNGFGVGTLMDTSADSPYLDCAYKLMQYAGKPRFKKSEHKETLPGKKQVFRIREGGAMKKDIVTLEGDRQEGKPLLKRIMRAGKRIDPSPKLPEIVKLAAEQIRSLPEYLRKLKTSRTYPVVISPALADLNRKVRRELRVGSGLYF